MPETDGGMEICYIVEQAYARKPPAQHDVGLVVYQLSETPKFRSDQLRKIFPAAFLATYSKDSSPHMTDRSVALGFGMHLPEPLSCQTLTELCRSKSASNHAPPKGSPDLTGQPDPLGELAPLLIKLVEVSTNYEEFAVIFGEFCQGMARRLNAEFCFFYLFSESEGRFSRAFSPRPGDVQKGLDFTITSALLDEVMNQGTPIIDNSFSGKKGETPHRKIKTKSVLYFPLIKSAKRIGVLEVINKAGSRGFGDADRKFLTSLMHPLAVIIDNAILFQNVERLCYTDDLTKLYNSRYLKQFLVSEVKRSLRYKKKVSLLFLDIDHFKAVNDVYGHLVGSETLVEIGRVLKGTVRDTDVVARYGGDEFVIVLPEVTTDMAMDVAERIRSRVACYRFGVKQNLNITLTISIGVATCSEHAITADGLIQKADIAMYQAKGLSKNSVCLAV